MRNYTLEELGYWSEKIEDQARKLGLDFFPQEFELCNTQEMKEYYVYIFSRRYPHWSFGKAYEAVESISEYVPFSIISELILNTNPCLAYLWEGNTLARQILVMAHIYARNDFFKNNIFHHSPCSENIITTIQKNAQFIRDLLENPEISRREIELFFEAAHSVRNQKPLIDSPRTNILKFILDHRKDLTWWQRKVLQIVDEEWDHLIPFLETDIIQKGWGSFWQIRILSELELPSELALECFYWHSKIVGHIPPSGMNPYGVGFLQFEDIKKKWDEMEKSGDKKIFQARKIEKDSTFLGKYLTKDLIERLKFVRRQGEKEQGVEEISWEKIREAIVRSVGLNRFPIISVVDGENARRKILYLRHEFKHPDDRRHLDADWARKTLEYLHLLWGERIALETVTRERQMPFVYYFDGKTHNHQTIYSDYHWGYGFPGYGFPST